MCIIWVLIEALTSVVSKPILDNVTMLNMIDLKDLVLTRNTLFAN